MYKCHKVEGVDVEQTSLSSCVNSVEALCTVFSSPVRRTESYSDTPGVSVSVSVSVKMVKFLVQVIQKLAIHLICVLGC